MCCFKGSVSHHLTWSEVSSVGDCVEEMDEVMWKIRPFTNPGNAGKTDWGQPANYKPGRTWETSLSIGLIQGKILRTPIYFNGKNHGFCVDFPSNRSDSLRLWNIHQNWGVSKSMLKKWGCNKIGVRKTQKNIGLNWDWTQNCGILTKNFLGRINSIFLNGNQFYEDSWIMKTDWVKVKPGWVRTRRIIRGVPLLLYDSFDYDDSFLNQVWTW